MIHDTEEDEASGRRKHCIVVVVQGRHRSRKDDGEAAVWSRQPGQRPEGALHCGPGLVNAGRDLQPPIVLLLL